MCIIGFVSSIVIFGHTVNISRPVYEYNSEAYVFRGDYSTDQSWTVLNEFRYVTVNSAGVKTIIGRSETDRITIHVENPNRRTVHAEAAYEGDNLTLEFRPTNITFDISDIKFGITNWLDDIFSGNSDIIVTVGFPATIYQSIDIRQGSGTMQINDLYSRSYDVEIGSGKCEFNRPASGDFKSNWFKLTLGSGSAVFSGMESDRFDIDIGSGSFTLDRLSGSGAIDMGSGKGSIYFCDKPENDDDEIEQELSMGSGNLTLYYPEDGGVTLDCTFGSGKIEIDGFDHKKTLNNSNYGENNHFVMGTGAIELDADMGSGTVTIKDTKSYSAPEIISEFKIYSSVDNAAASSIRDVLIITDSDQVLGEIIDNSEFTETGILPGGEIPNSPYFSGFEVIPNDPTNDDSINAAEQASVEENTAEDISREAA